MHPVSSKLNHYRSSSFTSTIIFPIVMDPRQLLSINTYYSPIYFPLQIYIPFFNINPPFSSLFYVYVAKSLLRLAILLLYKGQLNNTSFPAITISHKNTCRPHVFCTSNNSRSSFDIICTGFRWLISSFLVSVLGNQLLTQALRTHLLCTFYSLSLSKISIQPKAPLSSVLISTTRVFGSN